LAAPFTDLAVRFGPVVFGSQLCGLSLAHAELGFQGLCLGRLLLRADRGSRRRRLGVASGSGSSNLRKHFLQQRKAAAELDEGNAKGSPAESDALTWSARCVSSSSLSLASSALSSAWSMRDWTWASWSLLADSSLLRSST
jgi:hypothetical protein